MPILQDSQPSLHRNFCISAQGAIAHPYVKPMDLASVLSLARIRGFGKSCARFDRSWSLANRTSAMAEPIALGPSRIVGPQQRSPARCDRVSYELSYKQARPWCGVFL